MMRSRANTDPGSPAWAREGARKKQRKKKTTALKATSKSSKDTKLLASVLKGQVRESALLLKRGASAGAQAETTGESPLHLACGLSHSQSALLVSMLLQHGASANARSVAGQTPLHCCARSGNLNGLKALLLSAQGQVSMDPEDSNGHTPAKMALLRDHTDCFELLLQYGADPMKTDDKGAPLLHFAAAVDCWKAVQILCQQGAKVDFDFCAADGSTALHEAARSGSIASVASLLGVGADWRIKNAEGQTAEVVANLNNQDTIASMLHSCEEVDQTLGVDLAALPPPRLPTAAVKENAFGNTALPTHLPPPPRCPSKGLVAGSELPPPLPMSPRSAALQAPPSLKTPANRPAAPTGGPMPPSRSRALQQKRMQASKAAGMGIKLPLPRPTAAQRSAGGTQDDLKCRNGSPARTRRVNKRQRPSSMYIKAPPSNIPQTFGGYGYIPPVAPCLSPRRCA